MPSMISIVATAALGSLGTLTIQALAGPAIERRKAWHARTDANLNDFRQCLEDCMASGLYLQREIAIEGTAAEALDRIRADRKRCIENLDTSTARLCQLTIGVMPSGPMLHRRLIYRSIVICRDIVNSKRDDTDKVAALMKVALPLHAYICTSLPRHPLRTGKALAQLTEAIAIHANKEGERLVAISDESLRSDALASVDDKGVPDENRSRAASESEE